MVNRDGELVGIIFDGNLQSLVWDYVFDETQGRALAVHSSAIIEALRKIYDAPELADELSGHRTAGVLKIGVELCWKRRFSSLLLRKRITSVQMRREVRFPKDSSLESYARQLDFFKIELGVRGENDTVTYLSNFQHPSPR